MCVAECTSHRACDQQVDFFFLPFTSSERKHVPMTMIDAHSKTWAKENGEGVFGHVLFWVDMRPHSPLDAFFHVPKSRGLARFSQPLVVSPVSWSQDVENSGQFLAFCSQRK